MEQKSDTKPTAISFNKAAYAICLIAGIFFLFRKEISQAVIFFGIGLVFDPFNVQIPFPKRPFYQKAWLIVHLSITLALFVLELIG